MNAPIVASIFGELLPPMAVAFLACVFLTLRRRTH